MNPGKARIGRAIYWLVRPFEIVCAVMLFVMMTLTFVDVCGRYLFDLPVPGGFEITETLLAALIFAGLPALTRKDSHVVVDLLPEPSGALSRSLYNGAINASLCVMLGFVAVHLWGEANDALQYGESTAVLQIHLAPVIYFMSGMTFLGSLICLTRVFGVQDDRPDTLHDMSEETEL